MLVTTKGRYAMRLMTYIASFPDRKVALREVSEKEGISLKYLEQLAHSLVAADLLKSVRGHGGGYLLGRDAAEINAGEILRAAEGTTSPVSCPALEEGGSCPREKLCTTVDFWAGLDDVIENSIDSLGLQLDLFRLGGDDIQVKYEQDHERNRNHHDEKRTALVPRRVGRGRRETHPA